ncbi:hypothetical protein SUGI_0924360 [Cryptomeria japonica]|uniref:uncharacterized protein LOC131029798 isoform X2 n=1 Tax=Cryptomeria japonica TaxID=3369 RepID=UPI002414CD0E|nr:uncharacterized protein LOC131029798 isoform X2 [Cryptomeria japonica]GLJ44244.1 hypothetical protein SUGI_0924360 [Cryptomeria japonica]
MVGLTSRLSFIFFAFAFCAVVAALQIDSGLCKIVSCGKGRCNHTASDQPLGIIFPRCVCDDGWTQPSIGLSFSFLPCVIPNCSLDATCSKAAPAPAPRHRNSSDLLHPCGYPVCGEGSCRKTSDYGYACDCDQGYENLLNMTAGPCIRACSIGADCSRLGISLTPSQTPTPTPFRSADINKAARKETVLCQIAPPILSFSFLFLLRCL